jgi:hypothetical protein
LTILIVVVSVFVLWCAGVIVFDRLLQRRASAQLGPAGA